MSSLKRIYLTFFFLFIALTDSCLASPSRVVSLAPNLTEILFELGLERRIAAVTSYCDYPGAAKKIPKIGGMSNPSLEAVVAVRPEMVLMTIDGNPPSFEKKLKRIGIRTHVFRVNRIVELPQGIRELGKVLDASDRAEALAKKIESTIERIKAKSKRGEKKRVLFIIQTEPLIVAGSGTAIDEAIKMLGWTNVAAHAKGQYPHISLETMVAYSPDVIFISQKGSSMGQSSPTFLKRLSGMESTQGKKIFYVGDALYRMGPRTLDGVRELEICVQERN